MASEARSALGASPGARWYAVHTKPSKELVAVRHLRNQGYSTHCPITWQARRAGSRTIQVQAPFFPAYVFVKLDTQRDSWRPINGTSGVVRLVTLADRPSPLAVGLLEELIANSAADGTVRLGENLAAGDSVRIVGGAFDRLCGKLLTSEPRERVVVLLDALLGSTRVEVSRDRLVTA